MSTTTVRCLKLLIFLSAEQLLKRDPFLHLQAVMTVGDVFLEPEPIVHALLTTRRYAMVGGYYDGASFDASAGLRYSSIVRGIRSRHLL
jgi:hypothetical protein